MWRGTEGVMISRSGESGRRFGGEMGNGSGQKSWWSKSRLISSTSEEDAKDCRDEEVYWSTDGARNATGDFPLFKS
ncbi:hypothetical protein L6452_28790 [Arctium lappa]|uniref:Uncharacterized protein n=1 Tax=Arctium lappa TaxID=4217 RepID=A0ACB8ZZW9_ARCLA|nr:hypothetical protein L6452_28790 [Arctium lappa]